LFHAACLGAVVLAVGVLVWLLGSILIQGLPQLDLGFFTSNASSNPRRAGFTSAIRGSLMLMFLTFLIALPLGFGAAIYLEKLSAGGTDVAVSRANRLRSELAAARAQGRWIGARLLLRIRLGWALLLPKLNRLIEINISNLAAVPSIIYGLLGLAVFISILGMNKSILAGALTLAMLTLPIIIIASREALRAVPVSIEQGAMALGATRWQAVSGQVVPAGLSGMLTGAILAMSRAIGESAPLIVVGGVVFGTKITSLNPINASDEALIAMPLQAFFWAGRPQQAFQDLAATGIIVLLVVLLVMNGAAIILRSRSSKRW
jgi:phosphate transport system permease protein